MSMENRRPQLNLAELHQLKWLLGGLLALIAAWTVVYMDVEARTLLALITLAVPVMTVKPALTMRVPRWAHRLAFPFIAGPGALATILLAFGPASGNWLLTAGLLACVAVVLVIALLTLYLAAPIMRVLGVTGANVLGRLFGVVLGALAVQYVLDGLRGSFPQLHP